MLRVSTLKTVGRVAALVFLLVAAMRPWFADSHPATEETCRPPLVWLGGGHCACLVSLMAYVGYSISSHNSQWLLSVPPALPVLSTLLILLIRERRWLWICHLTAWGLFAIYSLFLFLVVLLPYQSLITWGAGLGGIVAVATLVGEIRIARLQFSMDHRDIGGTQS